MFGYRPSRFGGGGDPWFRVGTFDFGTTGVVSLIAIFGMVLAAVEGRSGPIARALEMRTPDVLRGEVWRLITWFVPNQPSIWIVFSAVVIFLLGGQLEAIVGKIRMIQFIAILVLTPAVAAALFDLAGISGTPLGFAGASLLSSSIFYAFIAYMPNAPFFFGIPAWVLGAVFALVELLALIADRNLALLLLFVVRVGGALVTAKSFGLAAEVPWIPSLPFGRGAPKASGRSPRRGKKSAPLTVVKEDRFAALDIDSILDQVSAFGVDSLTSEQKKKLKAYSKDRKKNR